jgi:hypothetical protein
VVAGVGRVDEAAAADVDADVVQVVEEHQVARAEAVHADVAAVAVLGGGEVGQVHAQLGVDVHDEAGAVEAARRGAAPHVRDAQVALGDRRRPRAHPVGPPRRRRPATARRHPHPPQRRQRVRADLAVDDQPVTGLEPAHGRERDGPEVAVGRHTQPPLHRRDRRPGVALAQDGLAGEPAPLGLERSPGVRADLAVDEQAVRGLEPAHRLERRGAEAAVHAHAQQALQVGDLRSRRARPEDAAGVGARAGLLARRLRRRRVSGRVGADRRGGHGQGHADALDGAPMPGRGPPALRALVRIAPHVLGGEVA